MGVLTIKGKVFAKYDHVKHNNTLLIAVSKKNLLFNEEEANKHFICLLIKRIEKINPDFTFYLKVLK